MNAPQSAQQNRPQLPTKYKGTVLIDAGHGSLDAFGKYTTPAMDGKFFDHKDKSLNIHGIVGNSVFYEGYHNRQIAMLLQKHLNALGVQALFIHDELIDTPRAVRIQRANALYAALGNKTFLVSLHSNAGGGDGLEIFTSVGKTLSDDIAQMISAELLPILDAQNVPLRGGLKGKEKDFDMVAKTRCPALLIEHDFFDTRKGLARLEDWVYMNNIIQAEARAINRALNKYF